MTKKSVCLCGSFPSCCLSHFSRLLPPFSLPMLRPNQSLASVGGRSRVQQQHAESGMTFTLAKRARRPAWLGTSLAMLALPLAGCLGGGGGSRQGGEPPPSQPFAPSPPQPFAPPPPQQMFPPARQPLPRAPQPQSMPPAFNGKGRGVTSIGLGAGKGGGGYGGRGRGGA